MELQVKPLHWSADPTEIYGEEGSGLGLCYKVLKLDNGTWSVCAPDCWIVNNATLEDAKAKANEHFAEKVRSVIVAGA